MENKDRERRAGCLPCMSLRRSLLREHESLRRAACDSCFILPPLLSTLLASKPLNVCPSPLAERERAESAADEMSYPAGMAKAAEDRLQAPVTWSGHHRGSISGTRTAPDRLMAWHGTRGWVVEETFALSTGGPLLVLSGSGPFRTSRPTLDLHCSIPQPLPWCAPLAFQLSAFFRKSAPPLVRPTVPRPSPRLLRSRRLLSRRRRGCKLHRRRGLARLQPPQPSSVSDRTRPSSCPSPRPAPSPAP